MRKFCLIDCFYFLSEVAENDDVNKGEKTESQVLGSSVNEGKRPGGLWMSIINFTVHIFLFLHILFPQCRR